MTEKILDKLSKLKAHMESAEKIGSEHEAQAFANRLQELLIKYKLSLVDIPGMAEKEIITIMTLAVKGLKFKQRRQSWSEFLATVVAKAYQCKILVSAKNNSIWFVGTEMDTKVAEFAYVTIVQTAEKLADRENKLYQLRLKRAGQSNGAGSNSGFRQSFLTGFCERLEQRLEETRHILYAEAKDGAMVPFRRREEALAKYMTDQFAGKPHAPSIKANKQFNNDGFLTGTRMADTIDLNKRAITTTNSVRRELT